MKRYIKPGTEVLQIIGAYMMQVTSTQTDHGGDQETGQAPRRRPF